MTKKKVVYLRICPWPLITESTTTRTVASASENCWEILSWDLFEKLLLISAA
jgi:hypothetical protein